jgi:hypothetical protein
MYGTACNAAQSRRSEELLTAEALDEAKVIFTGPVHAPAARGYYEDVRLRGVMVHISLMVSGDFRRS